MTSKVQPAADYWTVDRKKTWGQGWVVFFWWAEMAKLLWERGDILNKYNKTQRIGPDWQNLDRIASAWQNPDRSRKKSDCHKFPLKIVTWYLNRRWRRKKCDVALILQEWLRALVITKMKENMLYWMVIPFASEFPSMLQNVSSQQTFRAEISR